MKGFYYFAIAALLLVACDKETPEEQPLYPVGTSEATEVTMWSAVLYGYVNGVDYLTEGETGFVFSTSSTPEKDNGQILMASNIDKSGMFSVKVSGLASSTTYYYKAFLNTDTESFEGEVKSFTTETFEFAAVDIGLSVKWANANLGAAAPYEPGDFYAWGELEPKSSYLIEDYKWYDKSHLAMTKYNVKSEYGPVDNKKVLDPEDDAAHVKLGGKWRMPTAGEIDELISTRDKANYLWEWTVVNDRRGWLVTYRNNDNSIFLPAAGLNRGTKIEFADGCGYYWSSSLYTQLPYYGCGLEFLSNLFKSERTGRYYGQSVRPVCD